LLLSASFQVNPLLDTETPAIVDYSNNYDDSYIGPVIIWYNEQGHGRAGTPSYQTLKGPVKSFD